MNQLHIFINRRGLIKERELNLFLFNTRMLKSNKRRSSMDGLF